MIQVILYDFGGVIADEGWRMGLTHIAETNNIPFEPFFARANDLLIENGWMYGKATEASYWDAFLQEFPVKGDMQSFRDIVLSRFIVRNEVIGHLTQLKKNGYRLGILSDQTNWLDELNEKYAFFPYFDKVFNSYHLGRGKHDPTLFDTVVQEFGVYPQNALFIDDNAGHIERARARGLSTIHFTGIEAYRTGIAPYL